MPSQLLLHILFYTAVQKQVYLFALKLKEDTVAAMVYGDITSIFCLYNTFFHYFGFKVWHTLPIFLFQFLRLWDFTSL
jgi:hypothetical protein